MIPHIFFVDIDGTLLRHGTPPAPAVVAAAERFQQAGGRIALCTGRSALSTRDIARTLAVNAPCVLFCGAALYDFDADAVTKAFPLPGDAREVVRAFAESDSLVSVQAYTAKRAYLVKSNQVLRERGIREELEAEVTPVGDIEGDILKMVVTHPDPARLLQCADAVLDDRYAFAFASRRFAEITAKGTDKGTGVRAAADLLGVSLAHTFAAGDAMSDVPMLDACGYSFAPRDGGPEALAAANEVIPSCEENGMEIAFERAEAIMRSRAEGMEESASC